MLPTFLLVPQFACQGGRDVTNGEAVGTSLGGVMRTLRVQRVTVLALLHAGQMQKAVAPLGNRSGKEQRRGVHRPLSSWNHPSSCCWFCLPATNGRYAAAKSIQQSWLRPEDAGPQACVFRVHEGGSNSPMFVIFLLVLTCLFGAVPGAAASVQPDPCAVGMERKELRAVEPPRLFHYVFLVDTSASMMGRGDGRGRVLLPRVKAEIEKFLDQVPAGSRVTLQPFDDGPKPARTFEIPQEKAEALAYLRGIEARGKRTCVYRSVKDTLRQWPGNAQTGVLVFLFTDGNNNCPPPPTLDEVAREYRLRRGPYDWFYYLLLGLEVSPELEKTLEHEVGWKILSVAPDKVPRLPSLDVAPKSLELGNLHPQHSASRELRLQVGRGNGETLRLRVRTAAPELAAHGSGLSVTPALVTAPGVQQFNFQLLNPASLPHREKYQGYVCIEPAEEEVVMKPIGLPVQFQFRPRGSFKIEAIDTIDSLTLEPGASATVHYRLTGDSWASGTVTATVADTGEGLRVLVNGKPEAAKLAKGDKLSVSFQNVGMRSPPVREPKLELSYPPGTDGPAVLTLPAVWRPMTCGETLQHWWWLWLLLLPLLAWIGRGLVNRMRPWGYLNGTGPPPECANIRGELKGRQPLDIGKLVNVPDLEGIKLQLKGNAVVVSGIGDQPGRHVKVANFDVEDGDPFHFGEQVKVFVDREEKAKFVISQRPNEGE